MRSGAPFHDGRQPQRAALRIFQLLEQKLRGVVELQGRAGAVPALEGVLQIEQFLPRDRVRVRRGMPEARHLGEAFDLGARRRAHSEGERLALREADPFAERCDDLALDIDGGILQKLPRRLVDFAIPVVELNRPLSEYHVVACRVRALDADVRAAAAEVDGGPQHLATRGDATDRGDLPHGAGLIDLAEQRFLKRLGHGEAALRVRRDVLRRRGVQELRRVDVVAAVAGELQAHRERLLPPRLRRLHRLPVGIVQHGPAPAAQEATEHAAIRLVVGARLIDRLAAEGDVRRVREGILDGALVAQEVGDAVDVGLDPRDLGVDVLDLGFRRVVGVAVLVGPFHQGRIGLAVLPLRDHPVNAVRRLRALGAQRLDGFAHGGLPPLMSLAKGRPTRSGAGCPARRGCGRMRPSRRPARETWAPEAQRGSALRPRRRPVRARRGCDL